jgi:hypothetical protein
LEINDTAFNLTASSASGKRPRGLHQKPGKGLLTKSLAHEMGTVGEVENKANDKI